MRERLDEIAAKLTAIRARGLSCFGSHAHGFVMQPPATEADVAAFEAARRVRLPEDYRAFLLHVGHGGAGPYYGLMTLARWDDARCEALDDLDAECPLHPDTLPPGEDWLEALLPGEDDAMDRALRGTLSLGTQGCSYYTQLVVTGPARGRVVYVDLDGGRPYFPECTGFLDWYERWLDELLAGCKIHWFGIGMPGLEPELAGALRRGERLVDALAAMRRLPRVGTDTLDLVIARLDHPDARVREQALQVLGELDDDAAARARPFLRDPEAGPRRAALRAVCKGDAARWAADARAMLDDADGSIASAALRALDEAKVTTLADLAPRLRDGRKGVAEDAGWRFARMAGRGVPPAERAAFAAAAAAMLDHAEVRVVMYGAQVLAHVAAPELPELVARLRAFALGEEPSLRMSACSALVRQDRAAGLDALTELTRHADPFVRQDAARLLGELGDARVLPALERLLDDETKPFESTATGIRTNVYRVCDTARMAIEAIERRAGQRGGIETARRPPDA
ncbi:HEAT repeat domain-containing protein [Sorangium sp. So ce513]|uniref:HEAT repeat domain-containing protein n=1 Tax=Sorangium sp. So ce513 TaxID=3133315 RepID=UPI003F5F9D5C